MNNFNSRAVFAALCAIGFFAILCGAWWEISRVNSGRHGDDVPMSRQLKLRLFSAFVWMLIFAANFYAVVWLWPHAAPHTPLLKTQARRFLSVIGGAFCLLLPALGLLLIDLRQTARERQIQSEKRQREFAAILNETPKSETSSTRSETKN